MKKVCVLIIFSICQLVYGQEFQLASPITHQTRIAFYGKSVKIGLSYRLDGASIRYTLDNSPVTNESTLYTDSFLVENPCTIKAASFHPDFITSEPQIIEIIEQKGIFYKFDVNSPFEKYAWLGPSTLNDRKLGDLQFNKNYLGYNGQEIMITAQLKKKAKINSVIISALTNQASWIFGPSEVIVYDLFGNIIGQNRFIENAMDQKYKPSLFKIKCDGRKYKVIKIVIKPILSIPDWHNGRGNPAWLFVDEVWYE